MADFVSNLYKNMPTPTTENPHVQVIWIFDKISSEKEKNTAKKYIYCRNKYIKFLNETNAYYSDLELDRRFYLRKHWEFDALIRFRKWIDKTGLCGKTIRSLYQMTQEVMRWAFSLKIIDQKVYEIAISPGFVETKERACYSKTEEELINSAIESWIVVAKNVAYGKYVPTGVGYPPKTNPRNSKSGIRIEGKRLSVEQASNIYGINKSQIYKNIRKGLTGLDIVTHRSSEIEKTIVRGVEYKSITDSAKVYGLPTKLVRNRLRNCWSFDEAHGVVPRISIPKNAIISGVESSLDGKASVDRIFSSITPDQTVGIDSNNSFSKRNDELCILWEFENIYNCNALDMYIDYKSKSYFVYSLRKLLRIFKKLGVWPFIDSRIIMPLAMRLAMLTGLNPEAIKDLETDSYVSAHRLNNQPCIRYKKERSARSNRPVDKILNTGIFDKIEYFPEQSIAAEIEDLIKLVLDLTSKIRHLAKPEDSKKLFIFSEGIDKRDVVCAIEWNRKAGHWKGVFAREEGLYEMLGEDFMFNVARCRPTLATNMILKGYKVSDLQGVLGHSHITTTMHYIDEHKIRPKFNSIMYDATNAIIARSSSPELINFHNSDSDISNNGFVETLSGFGCKNAFNPSDVVRKNTKHKDGSACKYWNMCLFCENSVVTEHGLPKLIRYKNKLEEAVISESVSIHTRSGLYSDTIKMIDNILEPDLIFPKSVIDNALEMSISLGDELLDQLVYQGF